MRALFIYWGVQPTELPAALATARALQAQLLRRMPTLSAHLYQRVDTPGAVVTVMETYSSTGGLGDAQLRDIIDRSHTALAAWSTGGRHVEEFDRLDQPAL